MGLKNNFQRSELFGLLGELPSKSIPLESELISTENLDEIIIEKWKLNLNGIEIVPCLVTLPVNFDDEVPIILYNHAHGGRYEIGKNELIEGRSALMEPAYGLELARRGWASVCIDSWAFGERATKTESAIFKQMLWDGKIMWGMMVHDSLRLIDFIEQHPRFDSERIGTLGISMGSTMAWWCAALDKRIKVCVDICCMTEFQALIDNQELDQHGIYYYVPKLISEGWTTSKINSLIAPRPHLCLAGNNDPLTPSTGLNKIDKNMIETYTELAAAENWEMHREDVGHTETQKMRSAVLDFFSKHL